MKRATESNVEKYLEYVNFIKECSKKSYSSDLVLHRHHIVPRHIWNDSDSSLNDSSNLIYLSVEDHIHAHILYASAYSEDTREYIMNMRSARILSRKSIQDKRILDKVSETYLGENNPFYGKSHSEITRKKLSEITKDKLSNVSYKSRYGETADLEKEKRRVGVKNSWEKMTRDQIDQRRENISKSLIGKMSGGKNPFATPVLVNGIRYESIADAKSSLGVSRFILFKHYEVVKLERKQK